MMSLGLMPIPRGVSGLLRRTYHYKSALGTRGVRVAAGSRPDSLDDILVAGTTVRGRELDAIVVLGGGLWESKVIPPWAERRLDGAALLQAAGGTHRPSILICGGGSPHGLPVLDESTGQVVHEGTAYAEYLMDSWEVPASCILKESSSYDTIGNGYFSAMIHAIPAGWKRIAVVTSDFHMPRSRAIFEKVYGLVEESLGIRIELEFVSLSDTGVLDDNVRELRIEKEMKSVATWHKNTDEIENLVDFHRWLYRTHICYSVERQHLFGINPDSSGSY